MIPSTGEECRSLGFILQPNLQDYKLLTGKNDYPKNGLWMVYSDQN
jgi:hypothetical protein